VRIVLDVGALIGFERDVRSAVAPIATALRRGERVVVPAGVVAQVWRHGKRQARLARLLHTRRSEIVPLDEVAARAVGKMLSDSGTTDVVDASVVWCARKHDAVVLTSDPDDLRRLDPKVRVEAL
jgi:hypothetical protein